MVVHSASTTEFHHRDEIQGKIRWGESKFENMKPDDFGLVPWSGAGISGSRHESTPRNSFEKVTFLGLMTR